MIVTKSREQDNKLNKLSAIAPVRRNLNYCRHDETLFCNAINSSLGSISELGTDRVRETRANVLPASPVYWIFELHL